MSDYQIQTDILNKVTADHPPVQQVIASLIDSYDKLITPEIAQALCSIDFQATFDQSKLWFDALLASCPYEPDTIALYFGMYDAAPDDDIPYEYTQLYLDGSSKYSDNDEGEWAGYCSWTEESDFRYPNVPAMQEIGRLCSSISNACNFSISQAFAACLIIELVPTIVRTLDFQRHTRYPITLGHDSGDLYLLGYLTPDGLEKPQIPYSFFYRK